MSMSSSFVLGSFLRHSTPVRLGPFGLLHFYSCLLPSAPCFGDFAVVRRLLLHLIQEIPTSRTFCWRLGLVRHAIPVPGGRCGFSSPALPRTCGVRSRHCRPGPWQNPS